MYFYCFDRSFHYILMINSYWMNWEFNDKKKPEKENLRNLENQIAVTEAC